MKVTIDTELIYDEIIYRGELFLELLLSPIWVGIVILFGLNGMPEWGVVGTRYCIVVKDRFKERSGRAS